ncbi:AI-2E family transporter [Natronohydrobacter thiooxidans]|uniref:AI-2E family transporter n=1 Tax=Natronohydrobacter thiooxidans TaxID=87172 RepID=UPI0008FF4CC4|nr:AI-2E family transporter [Natronohydrobacter thiooxidans]
MRTELSPRPTASWLIAIILGVAALHWLQVLAVPIAFALFLMALVWPLHRKLERRASAGVAVLVSVLLLVAAAAGLLLFIGYGINIITVGLAPYALRMQEVYLAVGEWLESLGIALGPALAEQFRPAWLFGMLQGAAARINAIAGFLALTVIFLAMGLLEVVDVRERLPYALGDDAAARLLSAMKEIGWKFRRYMFVRCLVSVLTGILTWLFALLVGLELPVVWGALACALNFFPIIGSIAAVIPPVLFSFVQFDSWQMPMLVLAGMALIQFTIGNFLDPRLEGRALAMSPFVVITSIFFWGLVWGIPGAFIGVPLSIAVVTVCHRFHETCWIARLLTPSTAASEVGAANGQQ